MSFTDMPDLGPLMLPGAKEYAEAALAWSREAVVATRNELDIAYGTNFYQKLDVFMPQSTVAGGCPVLIFMHGGAWKNGFKEWMGFMAPPIVSLPAIFVSVNYRLVPDFKYPAPVDDCWSALAWVHSNIARYGGNPRRIFIGGHSAGGHIAALIAARPAQAAKYGLPHDVVNGCFPLSASFSLDLAHAEPGSRRESIIRLILARDEDGPDGTVLTHVTGNTVPFFLAHGANDLPDLIKQNDQLLAELVKQPGVVTRDILPDCDHFATNLDCRRPESVWLRTVRAWMTDPPAPRLSPRKA
jgi:arylformamidase